MIFLVSYKLTVVFLIVRFVENTTKSWVLDSKWNKKSHTKHFYNFYVNFKTNNKWNMLDLTALVNIGKFYLYLHPTTPEKAS